SLYHFPVPTRRGCPGVFAQPILRLRLWQGLLIPGVKGRQWTIQRVGVATFIRVGQPGLIVRVLDKLFDPQVEASQTRGAQCAVNNDARRREALYAPFVASFVARTVAFGIIPE